ncbi:MAG: GC-type dockerin domain-anchored protein, partial [Phycisphaerales bacterium JB059]
SYVDWVLGELRDLKANASKLAVDDAYAASGTLAAAANEGLLVNDISQALTTSMVDTAFDPGLDPAQGTVQINIDGSFSFTPAPGFEGDASFSYRSMATIETDLGSVNVFSDPATVVVRVSGSVGCSAADLAEPYGTLDFDDVLAFLVAFGSMDPVADLAPTFGTFDFDDILVFLTGFGAGCP